MGRNISIAAKNNIASRIISGMKFPTNFAGPVLEHCGDIVFRVNNQRSITVKVMVKDVGFELETSLINGETPTCKCDNVNDCINGINQIPWGSFG